VPAEIPPATAHDFYDFEAKYIDAAEGIVPAPLTPEQTADVRRLAVEAFEAASCEGLVRADFFLLDSGEFVINEINTMPGFTSISMYPKMWEYSGIPYSQLIDRLIELALERHAVKKATRFTR
jgi:D-alanine-D-alanine ligase